MHSITYLDGKRYIFNYLNSGPVRKMMKNHQKVYLEETQFNLPYISIEFR